MDGGQAAACAGGGGGPAPFLLKTYEMVDDPSTNHIVSWSPGRTSFVVWNPPEFSRLLLPTYFKHNNFSSFIRQLNTYGFHKIDPERWEFANEDFVKDKKHLLRNIHRRKPIHSHSHPQVDHERAAFDEEIDKLSSEKSELQAKVFRFQQQKSTAKAQLDDLKQRVSSMEERQKKLLASLEKAVQDPMMLEHLTRKIESKDFSAYYKKRRLPEASQLDPAAEHNFVENQSISRPEPMNIFSQDLSNNLTLELSPAVSERNLVSTSTHSSNEDLTSSLRKLPGIEQSDVQMKPCSLQFATEALEMTGTRTCLTFQMDSVLTLNASSKENSGLPPLQMSPVPSEEGDGNVSCQLNLTLASFSPFPANQGQNLAVNEEGIQFHETRSNANGKSSNHGGTASKSKHFSDDPGNLSSSQESPGDDKKGPTNAPVQVNDVFWEQFLTERPGSSDNEEASSNYRAIISDEQDDRGVSQGLSKAAKNLGNLSL
ncbi:hypothetical protein V2J09_022599 [Rumex salicifolius]